MISKYNLEGSPKDQEEKWLQWTKHLSVTIVLRQTWNTVNLSIKYVSDCVCYINPA